MHDVAELYRQIIYFQRAGDGGDHMGQLGGNKDTHSILFTLNTLGKTCFVLTSSCPQVAPSTSPPPLSPSSSDFPF